MATLQNDRSSQQNFNDKPSQNLNTTLINSDPQNTNSININQLIHHDPKNDIKVLLTYRDLSLRYMLNVNQPSLNGIVQVISHYWNNLRYHLFRHKHVKQPFYRLAPSSGYLEPGSSLCILSPPGSGRSTLLKLLTLSLPPTGGDILLNGITPNEAITNFSVDTSKMFRFVDQIDLHFDQLTVYETLEFAHRLSTRYPTQKFITQLLIAFGMEECKHTPTAQISGGQKRRLSLMLGITNPHVKVVAIDNLSDGLDHAITDEIISYLIEWAKINNTVFICSLQQPSPSALSQFERSILLRDGETVYNGPTNDLMIYFDAMGFPCPNDVELPEHIIHVLSHPKICLQELEVAKRLQLNRESTLHTTGPITPTPISSGRTSTTTFQRKAIQTSLGPLIPSIYPCIELDQMVDFYHVSPFYKEIENVINHIESLRIQENLPKTNNMLEREHNTKNDINNDSLQPDKGQPLLKQSTNDNDIATTTTNTNNNTLKKSSTSPDLTTTLSTLSPQPKQLDPLISNNTQLYYQPGYAIPVIQLLFVVLMRQLSLTWRNKTMMISRLIPVAIIAVVFGGLYFQIAVDKYSSRAASFIDVLVETAYSNLIELGLSIYYRQLIHSQLHLYPTFIYTLSVQIAGIPFALVESLILTVIPYALIGQSPYGLSMVTHFFMVWIHGMVMTSLFRCAASFSANVGIAYAIISPVISVLSLAAGFYIRLDALPKYLWWIHYISPFTFGLRSLLLAEFLSARYDFLIPNPIDPTIMSRAGNVYLYLNGFSQDPIWILMSVFYCFGVIILLILISSYFLYSPFKEYTIGTQRFETDDDNDITKDLDDQLKHQVEEEEELQRDPHLSSPKQQSITHNTTNTQSPNNNNNNQQSKTSQNSGHNNNIGGYYSPSSINGQHGDTIEMSNLTLNTKQYNEQSQSKSNFAGGNNKLITLTNHLPFTPASLSFENISFVVKDEKTNTERVILNPISAFVKPGQSIALMGSSGAGKTTLLNTLMGKNKTTSTSRVGGKIYINGQTVGEEISTQQFSSMIAIVEQFETLFAFDTVYETLYFSAKMRLENVDHATLDAVVTEVIDVLELTPARDLLIGSPQQPSLSSSQKKRVAIGVELVANPSIIFLDEPTTGLDSESALSVVRCISRIARSGRSIIVTIHQPSSSLFYMFDSLLLLGSGGFPCYFGPLGARSKAMIKYFTAIPGFKPCPKRTNPAEWLIEQVAQEIPQDVITQAQVQVNEYQKLLCQLISSNTTSSADSIQLFLNSYDDLTPKQQWIRFLCVSYMKSSTWHHSIKVLKHIVPTSIAIKNLQHCYLSATNPNNSNQTSSSTTALQSAISLDNNNDTKLSTTTMQTKGLNHEFPVKQQLPIYQQFSQLFTRSSHVFYRSSSFFYTRVLSSTLLSLFFAIFYLRIKITSAPAVITFLAATVISIGNTTYIMATTSLPIYVSLKPIFYREVFSNYYKAWLWPIPFMLLEFLWMIFMSLTTFICHYFVIGASADALVFFSYWLTCFVLCNLFTQFTLMLSMVFPSRITEVFQNVYVSLCFSFGNIAITYPTTNKIFRVIMRLLPFYYINRAITTEQFKDSTEIITVYIDNTSRTMELREYVSYYTGYTFGNGVFGWSMLWVLVMMGSFASMSFLGSLFSRVR